MRQRLERVLKWLLPVLIVVEIVLVWTGWLDLGTAIGVTVAIEVLLVLVAGRQLFVTVRRYRRQRTAGLDVWAALEEGLTVLLPRPLARVVSLEPRMIACLLLWLFRRRRPGAGQFSYHRRSWGGALLILVLLTVPVEIFVVELLVPWAWLRWVLLIAALYGVLWFGGLIASLKVLPHRLEAGGVRLRHGNLAEVLIPYHEIARRGATISPHARRARRSGDGPQRRQRLSGRRRPYRRHTPAPRRPPGDTACSDPPHR